MDDNIGLLGSLSGDGDGGGVGDGVASDESTTAGSILTSNNNNQETGISTEVSSPLSDENLELGLGLSIGGRGGDSGGGGLKSKSKSKSAVLGWCQFSRIVTTKDFTSLISNPSSNSSSSSVKNPNLSTLGSKRFANDSASSVVGWPPIRKGHKLTTQTKLPDEQSSSTPEINKTIGNKFYSQPKNGVSNKGYRPVKVHMDGSFIGRKVDLNAHNSYSTLAQTLEDMFYPKRSSFETAGPSKLLDAKSEFVLTYEDKDGDCMLVGDVPWQMFTSSVKRLRIMRNCESSELGNGKRTVEATTCQEKNSRQRTDAV